MFEKFIADLLRSTTCNAWKTVTKIPENMSLRCRKSFLRRFAEKVFCCFWKAKGSFRITQNRLKRFLTKSFDARSLSTSSDPFRNQSKISGCSLVCLLLTQLRIKLARVLDAAQSYFVKSCIIASHVLTQEELETFLAYNETFEYKADFKINHIKARANPVLIKWCFSPRIITMNEFKNNV